MALTEEQIRDTLLETIKITAPDADLQKGPIRDLFVTPVAQESLLLRTEVDRTRRLYSVDFWREMTRVELESLAYQYGVRPFNGSSASGIVHVQVTTVPDNVLVIPEGTVFATEDGRYTYVSSSTVEIPKENLQQFYSSESRRYEIPVTIVADTIGEEFNVAAFRITQIVSALTFNARVVNYEDISGGQSSETNEQLADRIREAATQNERGTIAGFKRDIRESDTRVLDLAIVRNIDSIGTFDTYRAQLDVFVIGRLEESTTELFEATRSENNQEFELGHPPIVEMTRVSVNDIEITSLEYQVVQNAQRSAAGEDSIKIRSFVPLGATVKVEYTYNKLLSNLASRFTQNETDLFGVDLRFREGVLIPVRVSLQVSVQNSENSITFLSTVTAKVTQFINQNKFVKEITAAGLREYLRDEVVGLLSVAVTDFGRVGAVDFTDVISFEDYEYPHISADDITVRS